MKNCVYRIINTLNNKVYIGSTIDSERRESEHFSQLENGVHINIHLQRAYDKYGKNAFIFDVIESDLCDSELIKKEQHYINLFNSSNENFGYNISQYADRPDGRKYTKVYSVNLRNALLKYKLNVNSLGFLFSIQAYLEQYTNRICFPNGKDFTNEDFSNLIGVSRNVIFKVLRELDGKGFIKRIGKSQKRQIFVNPHLITSGTEIKQETFNMFDNKL